MHVTAVFRFPARAPLLGPETNVLACCTNGCAQRGTRAPVAPRDAVAASGAGASWFVIEHRQPHAHAHPNRACRDPEHARAKEHHGQFAARLELAAPPVRRRLRRFDAAPSRQWRFLLPHWLRRPQVLTLAIRPAIHCPFWRIGLTTRVPWSQAIMSRPFCINAARSQARSTPDAVGARTALPAQGPGPFGARTDAAGAGGDVQGLAGATAPVERGGSRASIHSLRWAHHSCGATVRTGPLA